MKYGKIENGTVKEYYSLPKIFENIIGFENASIETINSKGFYEKFYPVKTPTQIYEAGIKESWFNAEAKQFIVPVLEMIPLTLEELQAEALQTETQKYIQRTQDGINAYAALSAEFRLAKLNGILSEEQQKGIERILVPVRNEVLAGQWISGLQFLEEIGNSNIGVDLYNRLHNLLTDYIAINYTT